MRAKHQKQMPLMNTPKVHPRTQEMKVISDIIDAKPTICDYVLQDLIRDKNAAAYKGANGMTAEQVLRAAIVYRLHDCTYRSLAFHLDDSKLLKWFCRIGIADKGFGKSALNANIKAISSSTWKAINKEILGLAEHEKIEKGREVRIDCTCVDTDIHPPSDSSLLWDGVRVLTRLIESGRDDYGIKVPSFHNHTRVAKRRMLAIVNAKRKTARKSAYRDLIKATNKVIGYAKRTIDQINSDMTVDPMVLGLATLIDQYVGLTQKVIDQTERRVIRGEKVAASEKVVSIFEPHTDIIVKDRRETLFGHKVCLAGGASNLILDCWILEGNPADSDLTVPMLDRQKQLYGRYPLKVSLDGGFASKTNLDQAKSRQIKDVCFAKKRGLKETDMCRSHYVYRRLRRFRAGIEAGISWLKRSLGLTRCNWKGWRSFKSYVWSSVVAANLLTIARAKLKPAKAMPAT
jgi:IS5 family transposase